MDRTKTIIGLPARNIHIGKNPDTERFANGWLCVAVIVVGY